MQWHVHGIQRESHQILSHIHIIHRTSHRQWISNKIGNLYELLPTECYAGVDIVHGNSVHLSVCLSVCHMHALYQNRCMDRADFFCPDFPLPMLQVF